MRLSKVEGHEPFRRSWWRPDEHYTQDDHDLAERLMSARCWLCSDCYSRLQPRRFHRPRPSRVPRWNHYGIPTPLAVSGGCVWAKPHPHVGSGLTSGEVGILARIGAGSVVLSERHGLEPDEALRLLRGGLFTTLDTMGTLRTVTSSGRYKIQQLQEETA